MIGIGAMLGQLSGNGQTVAAYQAALGKTIATAEVDKEKDVLRLVFADGSALVASDEGQSCCESRYMTCDDDLAHFAGSQFTGMDLRDGPERATDYEVHEEQFLIVRTSVGEFTVANHNQHNQHNGYYGGFHIVLRAEAAPGQ